MGAGDRRAELSVLLKPADGPWSSIGKDVLTGIVPEGVTLTANESGPDTASFALRREPSRTWPDLIAFNQCEVHVAGTPVWGGRVWEAPLSDGGEDVIGVQCRGWQYHLDDDLLQRSYVRTALGDWRDSRQSPQVATAVYTAIGQVLGDGGVVTLQWPAGSTTANNVQVGVLLDLGSAAEGPKRIVLEYETSADSAAIALYARSHDLEGEQASVALGAGSYSDAISGVTFTTLGRSGTTAGTFATKRRYVTILIFYSGGAGTHAVDWWLRLKAVRLFRDTAYESANASILKADQVIKDVITSGSLPLLDTATDQIVAGTFSIPDLAPQGYQSPRAIIAAANAYEGNLVGVDLNRKMFSRERDTVPRVEVGEWSGSQFTDASTNSAEALYNRVIVQGSGPDGAPIAEIRTGVVPLLDRQGFDRTAVLQVGAPMTTASAQALGDIWLADRSAPKFKGTITVAGHGGARSISGGGIHASELLLRVGQMIRVGIVDPATGDVGRDGLIKSVSYSHDSETATVELDNERGNLETLLERLAVVTSQAVR